MAKTGQILSSDSAGVNQILPHVNKWAWDLYKTGKRNNWDPEEIPMTRDIKIGIVIYLLMKKNM